MSLAERARDRALHIAGLVGLADRAERDVLLSECCLPGARLCAFSARSSGARNTAVTAACIDEHLGDY